MLRNLFTFLLLLFFVTSMGKAQIMFTASLDGDHEAPDPVSTTATGTAWAVLSTDLTTLSYHVTYAQLDSTFTAAHFHLGAAGVPGGVIQGINFNGGNTVSGDWTNIPDSIVAKLLKGEVYINVHSQKHPAGEIRGQLIPVTDGIGFTAALDAAQETGTVTSDAKGTGWAVLKNNGTEIDYRVTVAGLTSNLTMAHFHNAPAGVPGGVVQGITFTDSTSSGTWTGFADSIIAQILKERLYFNVHTTNYPAGEIRGQLLHRGEIMFAADIDPDQETSSVTSDANGTAWAVLTSDKTALSYQATYAQLTSGFTAAHFHIGAAGVPGGVVHPITFNGNTAMGEWTGFADSILAKLIKEEIYINIHSVNYGAGELRGQMELVNGIGFTSNLNAEQETSPVTSNGTGTGWAVLSDTGKSIDYNVTVAGLTSALTMAHFHNAPAGTPGGVVQGITFTDSSSQGSWTGFAENIITELLKNRLYFNVHTTNYGSGEIRGQIEFSNVTSGNIPVELSSFTAAVSGSGIELNWATASELNNSGFEIQKSQDNIKFHTIGFVKGKETTSEAQFYKFVDNESKAGKYFYRLKQIDLDGTFKYSNTVNILIGVPNLFALEQNYPNPFNPATTIRYNIPENGIVNLKVYNILGKEVANLVNEFKEAGAYELNFDAAQFGLASGVYLYKLEAGGKSAAKKFILLK